MSVFQPISLIQKTQGNAGVQRAKKDIIKATNQASIAIREKYDDTGTMLGQGAFGQVFAFTERSTGRPVAVKIMRKELLTKSQQSIVRDEIGILSLLDHANVVKYLESYEDPRYMYIIMESMSESIELQELFEMRKEVQMGDKELQAKPLFSEEETRHIMWMLVSACNHIHKNGVTHRDMKPQNVLFNVKENTLKVIDFGLSKSKGENKHSGFLVGTPNFMSPEIYERDGDDHAYCPPCDMFAVGVIMYMLVSGILPFSGTHEEVKD
jgi:serine/threonine protein kinase